MSICAYPQLRIYEDFDKMSAKEVYYNEAGKKITVKLLHFPDVPPEEISKIKFDDDDEVDPNVGYDRISGAYTGVETTKNGKIAAPDMDYGEEGEENVADVEDEAEDETEQNVNDDQQLKRISTTTMPNNFNNSTEQQCQISSNNINNNNSRNSNSGNCVNKKAYRKKSSGNLLNTRKCSVAFAQAHGIKVNKSAQAAPPTILVPPKCDTATNSSNTRHNVATPFGGCCRGNVENNSLRHWLFQPRRSVSPNHNSGNLSPGYTQYSKSLLEVPLPRDYGYASSDDLSSEWDSDVSSATGTNLREVQVKKPSGWRKIRNIVQWTPFFQTYKKQRYPWVQLAGHQGNFKAGPEQGTVLKKLCPKEEDCFQELMHDLLKPYVPEYRGQVTSEDGELYLQLQDLLSDFYQPCVMDCKIGVRTYLEEELSKAKEKPKLRKDMYEKMIQIDQNAPNEEEHKAKGVTKPRYMVWRETISSTATLGFRIEGIKKSDGTSSKDFKTTKSRDQIKKAFHEFISGFQHALPRYIQRLQAIQATLHCSDFFRTHEVIGSSLLFVHDRSQASVWLIDFAKTILLPENLQIDHNTKWKVGNHEDGYLIGIRNLIEIFSELEKEFADGEMPSQTDSFDSLPNSSSAVSTTTTTPSRVYKPMIDKSTRNTTDDVGEQYLQDSIVDNDTEQLTESNIVRNTTTLLTNSDDVSHSNSNVEERMMLPTSTALLDNISTMQDVECIDVRSINLENTNQHSTTKTQASTHEIECFQSVTRIFNRK